MPYSLEMQVVIMTILQSWRNNYKKLLCSAGHYMFAHVKSDNLFQTSTLLTPEIQVHSVACLTFYIAFHSTDASLTVIAVGGSDNHTQQLVYLRKGFPDWSLVEVEVFGWVQQVAFVVTAGTQTSGGVGIDDVSIQNNLCTGEFCNL